MDWGAAGVVVGVVSLIGLVTVPLALHAHFAHWLKEDPIYRKNIAKALTYHAYLEGYRDQLGRALAFLDSWMGNLGSWRGAGRGLIACYVLALLYTALFFLIAWFVGGPFGVGKLDIMPDVPGWQRALWLGGFAVIGGGFGFVALYGILPQASNEAIVIVGTVVFALGTFALFGTIAEGFTGVVGLTFVASGSVILAYGGGGKSILIFALATASLVSFAIASDADLAILLFFGILPVANLLLDWPSWWISRWLGRRLLKQTSDETRQWVRLAMIIGHAVIDLVTAIVFLVLLALALAFVVEGVAPELELDAFIEQAVQNPWPNAIWIVLMLLSTLVPTLLHFGALVASPLALWLPTNRPRAETALALIEGGEPEAWAVSSAAWFQVRFWVIATVAPFLLLGVLVGAAYWLTGGVAKHLVWSAEVGIWLAR